MYDKLPKPIQELVSQFSQLPGVGPKSALRMAMTLLSWPEEKVIGFGKSIAEFRSLLNPCSGCMVLTEQDPCPICSDPRRDEELLCVVADMDSMFVLEEPGFYRGKYFILGGLLSPLDGKESSKLNVKQLRTRLTTGQVQEVILALGSTVEAENTASFVKNLVNQEFPAIKITRLAQGIPLGAEVKYMDQETLKQSLQFRQQL